MKTKIVTTLFAALAALSISANAQVNLSFSTVGNAGNAADTTGFGGVSYTYAIGTYDVTDSQYTSFLNAVDPNGTNPNSIYNTNMGIDASNGGISFTLGATAGSKYSVIAGFANAPVVYVSWFDAARFTNWLSNGQGSGSTETGAYTLNGATSGIITNNGTGTYWIPTENEWYKAAYYDPNYGGVGVGGYWTYATKSNSITTSMANYNYAVGHVTDVGAYGIASAYGTYDQAGDVWQWNDAVISSYRGLRGGSWNANSDYLQSSFQLNLDPTYEDYYIGFRVATVPEPTVTVSLIVGMGMLAFRRKRPSSL